MRGTPSRWAMAALAAAAALCVPAAVRASPPATDRPPLVAPSLAAPPGSPSPRAVSPDERLREIVALVENTRERAGAPGLRDEERDALAELAWAQVDESLDDPVLRERARRDPPFLRAQALLLMDDGEDEEALATLERLQLVAPSDPRTHRLLGLALMGLERAGEAAEEYRRALALGAGDAAEVRALLAYALAAAGSPAAALAESERAIAEDPAAYLGHLTRGWILGELGRAEEGRREYLTAVAAERDDADLWALLAESWEAAGEGERAREAWREVLRIDPSDDEVAAKLGAKTEPQSP